jgi:endonuclease/exonuclease/phosphatase (EEP) superfamily protein YafD
MLPQWLKSLVYVDWSRRRRLLRKEAWGAIILAYVGLALAWLLPGGFGTGSALLVIWTWLAMLARVGTFHIGLGILVVAALAAVARQYRMALACLPLILLTVSPALFSHRPLLTNMTGRPLLRVMSVNLLMVNRTTGPIIDEIASADPDILFLQEYTGHWHDALQERLGGRYPHVITYPEEDSFGAAIYSKRPFVGKPTIDTSLGKWGIAQLVANIDVEGVEITCWNLHLVPPRNYAYTVEHLDQMRDLLPRLKAAAARPLIVAGDFNFTGATLQAASIRQAGVEDSFEAIGAGRGATWPVNSIFRYLPGIRLDHIYLGGGMGCRSIRVGEGRGSDHRPLVAEITAPGAG